MERLEGILGSILKLGKHVILLAPSLPHLSSANYCHIIILLFKRKRIGELECSLKKASKPAVLWGSFLLSINRMGGTMDEQT
jgi:hypothetical protein